MENEELKEKQVDSGEKEVDNGNNYIEAIKEIKQNSVPKDEYEKLENQNRELLKALVNGETIEAEKEEDSVDIEAIRKSLFSVDGELTNLEYATQALKLRDALIKDGKPDPFLPYGTQIKPSSEDIEASERVAKVLQECIDYADGDSEIFTNELMRRTVDAYPQNNYRR